MNYLTAGGFVAVFFGVVAAGNLLIVQGGALEIKAMGSIVIALFGLLLLFKGQQKKET